MVVVRVGHGVRLTIDQLGGRGQLVGVFKVLVQSGRGHLVDGQSTLLMGRVLERQCGLSVLGGDLD